MAGQMPEREREVPRVILAERVIEKIVQGAQLYPEPETGEAMVGLIVTQAGWQEPDIYVLDTISPGEHAVREWGMFEQGGDWQEDVFNWLHANWEAFRDLRSSSYGSGMAAKWDLPLEHVGDWHKQPGSMIAPSGGDEHTARAMIDDVETPLDCLVAPIVTMYPVYAVEPEPDEPANAQISDDVLANANGEMDEADDSAPDSTAIPALEVSSERMDTARVDLRNLPSNALTRTTPNGKYIVRVDFWYISRRRRRFLPVNPVVWSDDRLPSLPPVAWQLAHPKRFDQEFRLLSEAGYAIDVVEWDADGRPPYEICFSVYHPGKEQVVILVTTADYPVRQPAIRVAPLVNVEDDEDVFEKLYAASKPVLPTQMPEWTWDSKRTLIELVWHIEKVCEADAKGTKA